jgi:tetratricopeptide (TPR) repeat protein
MSASLQWMLLVILLTGCTAPQTRLALEQATALPNRAIVADVPFYPQEAYYCGPAALAMILTWAGIPSEQNIIATQIYTPGRQGTLPQDVLTGARRNGALAAEINTMIDILTELSAGNPVLVFQNLGLQFLPQWHFAVAVGYDLTNETLILHSGSDPQRISNLNAFEKTWQRAGYWAITVTAPNHLPATISEITALKAAAGLERAANYHAAITAYHAIIQRWPESIIARMGTGNTEYKRGSFAEAAAAFRAAIQIDHNYAAAWNNLANTLAAQGIRNEAVDAARKAVSLDPANSDYQSTLSAIIQLRQ